MNDSGDNNGDPNFANLKRQQERLLEERGELISKLHEGEVVKSELHKTRCTGRKLTNQRDKLRGFLTQKRQYGGAVEESKTEDSDSEVFPSNGYSECESVPNTETSSLADTEHMSHVEVGTGRSPVGGGGDGGTFFLRTQLSALKIENTALVKERRKCGEQQDSLVQELAAFNSKCERLQTTCDRLYSENQRLSLELSRKNSDQQSSSSTQEEDIELLKAQLRVYQEDCKAAVASAQMAEMATERMRAELNEARMIIRELRMQPRIKYPEFQPVYEQVGYVPRGAGTYRPAAYHYERDPMDYRMTPSYSGGYIGPQRNEVLRRGVPSKKVFLSPDMTAVVDNDVPDASVRPTFKSI